MVDGSTSSCSISNAEDVNHRWVLKLFDRSYLDDNGRLILDADALDVPARIPDVYPPAFHAQLPLNPPADLQYVASRTFVAPHLSTVTYRYLAYEVIPPEIRLIHMYAAFEQLISLHCKRIIHGDVRLANLLLKTKTKGSTDAPQGSSTEASYPDPDTVASSSKKEKSKKDKDKVLGLYPAQLAFFIDFDLSCQLPNQGSDKGSRKGKEEAPPEEDMNTNQEMLGASQYHRRYNVDVVDTKRHPDARPSMLKSPLHDLYSFFMMFVRCYRPKDTDDSTPSAAEADDWWFTKEAVDKVFLSKQLRDEEYFKATRKFARRIWNTLLPACKWNSPEWQVLWRQELQILSAPLLMTATGSPTKKYHSPN
mmetsp:Transcript_1061/g.3257  ORF Transcript_1061/g.3257 Transcript_1061/m.3257 type:complete len:365 (+) Transcript_1061:2968-4062(+)